MLHIKHYIILFLLLVNFGTKAQNSVNDFLHSVSKNNKTLATAREYTKYHKFETKTGIAPENPEFEFGYFPGNSANIGTKKVIGISQSMEFPSSYIYKNKIAKTRQSLAEIEYQKLELEVLNNAKEVYNEAVYLNKISVNLSKRVSDALQMVTFYVKKQENGDATQLEVNKAKLFLLNIQNKNRLNNSKIKQNAELIKNLNGGNNFTINNFNFSITNLKEWHSIEIEIDSLLPDFKYHFLNNQEAGYKLKLSKSDWLPNLMLGYESEEILGDRYSGLKAGISIPLWENKTEVKKAKADLSAHTAKQDEFVALINSNYYSYFLNAEALQQNLQDFKKNLFEMNNEHLLSRSLELGQISAIEYFMELDYFYEIQDELLALEYQYQQSLVKLYSYKR